MGCAGALYVFKLPSNISTRTSPPLIRENTREKIGFAILPIEEIPNKTNPSLTLVILPSNSNSSLLFISNECRLAKHSETLDFILAILDFLSYVIIKRSVKGNLSMSIVAGESREFKMAILNPAPLDTVKSQPFGGV